MEIKKRYIILSTLFLGLILISSCTSYHVKIGDAEIDMMYFLQDKDFESITFNPETHTFTLTGMKSETSQIVEAAISAALRK